MGGKKQPAGGGVTLRGGRTVNFVPRPETFPEEDTNPRGIGLLFRVHSLDSRAMAELAVAAARDLLEFLPDSDEIYLDVVGERTESRQVDLSAETGLVDSLGEWTTLVLFAADEVGRPDFQFRWCITAVKRVAWCDLSLMVKARQVHSNHAGGVLMDCADRFCAAFEVTSGIGVYTRPMDAVPVLRDPDWTTKIQPGWVVQRDRRLEYWLTRTWEMLAAPTLPSPCVYVPDGEGRGYFRPMYGQLDKSREDEPRSKTSTRWSFVYPEPRLDQVSAMELMKQEIVPEIGLTLRVHTSDSRAVTNTALEVATSLIQCGLPRGPVSLSSGGRRSEDDRYSEYQPNRLPTHWDAPDDWMSLSAWVSAPPAKRHAPPIWGFGVGDVHGSFDVSVSIRAGLVDDEEVARLLLDLARLWCDRFEVSSGIGVLGAIMGVPHPSADRSCTAMALWAWALQRRHGASLDGQAAAWEEVAVAGVPKLAVYVPVGDGHGHFDLLGTG